MSDDEKKALDAAVQRLIESVRASPEYEEKQKMYKIEQEKIMAQVGR